MALMNYPFGKETSSYRQSETITPYQKEGQILDTKIGKYLKISSFWRLIFLISISISGILSLSLISLYNTNPYGIIIEPITSKGYIANYPSLLKEDINADKALFSIFVLNNVLNKKNRYNTYLSTIVKKTLLDFDNEKSKIKFIKWNNLIIKNNKFKGEIVDNSKIIWDISGLFNQKYSSFKNDIIKNPLHIYIEQITISKAENDR